MIIRIVKLHFQEQNTSDFEKLFDIVSPQIRKFEGCKKVELLHDISNPEIYFTYSWWDKPEDLEVYRSSDLFKHWWAEVKKLFAQKAEAWSLEEIRK